MTHKYMTMNSIFRAAMAGSLALFLGACDSSSDDTAVSDEIAGDTISEAATAGDTADAAGDAVASGEVLVTVKRDANGVATGEITVGNPDAVEMIEYASLTCSHCARHHIEIWPEIKKTYVDTGKLKMTFRLFARDQLDEIVSMVPLCVVDERIYPIIDLMLSRQDRWLYGENGQAALNNLAALVRRTGLSRATFDACIRDQAVLTNIRTLREYGVDEDNVTGTPTFVLDGKTFSSISFEDFVERIEDAL